MLRLEHKNTSYLQILKLLGYIKYLATRINYGLKTAPKESNNNSPGLAKATLKKSRNDKIRNTNKVSARNMPTPSRCGTRGLRKPPKVCEEATILTKLNRMGRSDCSLRIKRRKIIADPLGGMLNWRGFLWLEDVGNSFSASRFVTSHEDCFFIQKASPDYY